MGPLLKYTPAVDGLRAIAVILVLLFHAKVSLFSGGYVGVDVFFVISGYLITTLIARELEAGAFTLLGFYERRVRRIVPAFVVVVVFTLVAGAIVLVPPDLAQVGASAVAAATFLANFYFWSQGERYLFGNTELMPLLHTWSLAIEEQFYVVFPALMLILTRSFQQRLLWVIGSLAVASFALSVYLAEADAHAAFYFSPARAWELLVGAWLALDRSHERVPRSWRALLQCVGLAMIFAAAIAYTRQTAFPGLAGLLPVIGTGLLVAWCRDDTPVVRALSNRFAVGCGLVSYSLYLWHWPLLVLAKRALFRDLAWYEVAGLYSLAAILAVVTWKLVEQPFRKRRVMLSRRVLFRWAAGTAFLIVAVGLGLRTVGGWLGNPPPEVVSIMAAARDRAAAIGNCHNWSRAAADPLPDCVIGAEEASFDFALWGDSQAGALSKAVGDAAKSANRKGVQLSTDNCPPLLHTAVISERRETDCEALNDAALALIRKLGVRRVILVGQWFQYAVGDESDIALRLHDASPDDPAAVFAASVERSVEELRRGGLEVTIVGPVPYIGWPVPSVLAAKTWRHRALPTGPDLTELLESQRGVYDLLARLQTHGASVLYPHERLCRSTCLVALNGDILYSDTEHLTTRGAALLEPMFAKELADGL